MRRCKDETRQKAPVLIDKATSPFREQHQHPRLNQRQAHAFCREINIEERDRTIMMGDALQAAAALITEHLQYTPLVWILLHQTPPALLISPSH